MILDKIEVSIVSGVIQIRYRVAEDSDQFHRRTIERGDSASLIEALGTDEANKIINTYWEN